MEADTSLLKQDNVEGIIRRVIRKDEPDKKLSRSFKSDDESQESEFSKDVALLGMITNDSETVYDLLVTTVTPTDDLNFYIDDGLDGFPAFGFRPGSEVKQPYRLYLPEKLPAEFTLLAIFKPISFRTSYLFAVLNPFETVVQLGIRISDGPGSNQNISLVYTNSDEHSHSEEVAKFTVPKLTKKWSKIVIKVSITDVTLYLNCHEMARQKVTRIPLELVFDTASTLYMAQAGPHIQERYDVSGTLQHQLRYTFDKAKAKELCKMAFLAICVPPVFTISRKWLDSGATFPARNLLRPSFHQIDDITPTVSCSPLQSRTSDIRLIQTVTTYQMLLTIRCELETIIGTVHMKRIYNAIFFILYGHLHKKKAFNNF
ncbi:collagen alpha-1(XVIII) chain isoform X2 [Vespula squamosa]|uniref:Collagen alpha-1(XVIII) chain isoform X2 n=1 Tax=Vespula squamosa TaxID=30214 RepID=A0ABD2ADF3_VESSQ